MFNTDVGLSSFCRCGDLWRDFFGDDRRVDRGSGIPLSVVASSWHWDGNW